ncbi:MULTISPECIES: hypothetical protein [unclassified Erwinia]|uniref:hypothetical protein n=1 Tax=unclassified Erwinia TaxID=2622719 RepID=UPI0011AF22AC|nr:MULTISPECIES: hypothetical protein [unclassified Erwinia]
MIKQSLTLTERVVVRVVKEVYLHCLTAASCGFTEQTGRVRGNDVYHATLISYNIPIILNKESASAAAVLISG